MTSYCAPSHLAALRAQLVLPGDAAAGQPQHSLQHRGRAGRRVAEAGHPLLAQHHLR